MKAGTTVSATRRRGTVSAFAVALIGILFIGTLPAQNAVEEASAHARSEVARLSQKYLEHIDREEYEAAYAMVGAGMRNVPNFETWKRSHEDRAFAGDGIAWRLTPFIGLSRLDSAEREPGLYALTEYATVSHTAGPYHERLLWYFNPHTGKFLLTTYTRERMRDQGWYAYRDVARASRTLQGLANVTLRQVAEWRYVERPGSRLSWALAPVGHHAWPSMVLRVEYPEASGNFMPSVLLCGASAPECEALNDRIRKDGLPAAEPKTPVAHDTQESHEDRNP